MHIDASLTSRTRSPAVRIPQRHAATDAGFPDDEIEEPAEAGVG
jgi:hypothetical protein